MKIGRALAEKKAAQNKLARLIAVRSQVFLHDKGKKPDMAMSELNADIESVTRTIRDFKLRIIYTNCNTHLDTGATLQEAIIQLGDIRSELSAYNGLLNVQPESEDELFSYRRRTAPRDRVPQLTKKDLLARIEALEARKYELDALIAKANNTVELVERIPRGGRS